MYNVSRKFALVFEIIAKYFYFFYLTNIRLNVIFFSIFMIKILIKQSEISHGGPGAWKQIRRIFFLMPDKSRRSNRDNPPGKTERSRLSISDPIKSERIWKTAPGLARQHITHPESCLSAWFPRKIPRRLWHGINSDV